MNDMQMHPDLLQELARQKHQSVMHEAKMSWLLQHISSSRRSWSRQMAHRLGSVLVELGSRLQERQRPIL
jgi:hypothetical protein